MKKSSILFINDIEFKHNGYAISEDVLTIQIKANNIEQIESAVGNSANLSINNGEYEAYGMALYRITKEYTNKNKFIFYVDFIKSDLDRQVQNNSENIENAKKEIEIISNAIVELAKLLGGNE